MGNTGSGKTALLSQLKDVEERVIETNPEALALGYVSNSTIIDFMLRVGAQLDVFFRLLWRHVFTIELLWARFAVGPDDDGVRVIQRLRAWIKGPKHRAAIEYLERWGKSFWEETEKRVK